MIRLFALLLLAAVPARTLAAPVATGEPKGFDAAVEDVVSHNRAALAHLREQDIRLALVEIAFMQETFGLFAERYGKDRPARHIANPDYVTTLVDVPVRMVTAQMMIDFGRLPIAYNSLVATCRSLMALLRVDEDAVAQTCGEPIALPPRPE